MKTRIEIKEKAKEMLKGKLWIVFRPLLVIIVIEFVLGLINGLIAEPSMLELVNGEIKLVSYSNPISVIMDIISLIVSVALEIGLIGYILKFIRGKNPELIDMYEIVKEKWLLTLCVGLLTGLFVSLGFVFLIIPGIIVTFGLSMVYYLIIDEKGLGTMDIIRKSWEIMKGHKAEYFVLGLSFIGWCILSCLTFGILFIYVIPYMNITFALYYEELRKISK